MKMAHDYETAVLSHGTALSVHQVYLDGIDEEEELFSDEEQPSQDLQQSQPPPFFAFFGLDEDDLQQSSEHRLDEVEEQELQFQDHVTQTAQDFELQLGGDVDRWSEPDDGDDQPDDQSGVQKEGNDLLIMTGAIDVGEQATVEQSIPDAVLAEVADTINEEEVRQRIQEEIMLSAVQAQVVVPERKTYYGRHLPYCITLTTLVAIATSVLAILFIPEHSAQQIQKQATTRPVESPTQSPLGDFVRANTSESTSQLLNAAKNHTMLARLLDGIRAYDLVQFLNEQITLFAPTDESFSQLSEPYTYYFVDASWIDHLNFLLAYHIVTQPLNRVLIFSSNSLPTAVSEYSTDFQFFVDSQSQSIPVNRTDMTIDSVAHLVVSDIQASNGYIQVPDRVLLPNDLRLSIYDYVFDGLTNSISEFTTLLKLTSMEDNLKQNISHGFTLFLPNDSAFASLDNSTYHELFTNVANASDVVSYHMTSSNVYATTISTESEIFLTMSNQDSALVVVKNLPNGTNEYFIDGAQIVDFVFVGNGVVALVDKVLFPPSA